MHRRKAGRCGSNQIKSNIFMFTEPCDENSIEIDERRSFRSGTSHLLGGLVLDCEDVLLCTGVDITFCLCQRRLPFSVCFPGSEVPALESVYAPRVNYKQASRRNQSPATSETGGLALEVQNRACLVEFGFHNSVGFG